jgi:3-oxoadipate enol-lactonase
MPNLQRGSFTTYYEESGQGVPVVLICGIGAELQSWRFNAPELSKHFRVICFDNRGAGRSSAPDEPYSLEQMVEDLAALLDHLQIPAASLIGWSMGGMVAQLFALAHPGRIRSLVLLHTTLAPDAFVNGPFDALEQMRRSDIPYECSVRFLARMVYSPSVVNNSDVFEKIVQFTLNNPYRQTLTGFLRQLSAVRAHRAADVSAIRARTVVLAGEADQLTPTYVSQALAAAIPNAELSILPGGHAGFVEHPDVYNRAFIEALRDH